MASLITIAGMVLLVFCDRLTWSPRCSCSSTAQAERQKPRDA